MKEDSPLDFLAGGGDMGARIRALEWSSTAVGPPESWPQSLRTTVRLMLDSRFAMWMAWGKELTFFCNDAYLPTVGLKRDWVLGARSDRVWEEIWHDIGPRIESVLQTGHATWDEALQLFLRRNGYDEETFHTFSYSPVYDEANRTAGMLCVVVEVTERVISERRLNTLRELASVPVADMGRLADVARALLAVLGKERLDVPFAAFYLSSKQSAVGELVGTTLPDGVAAPIDVVENALGSGVRVVDLPEVGVDIFGPWPERIRQTFVVPLRAAGSARQLGCLVLAVSTRRTLDAAYESFLSLVADQFASKLSDVQAKLDAEARAESLAELDRAKNLFFNNVSHELRTPLTLLLGPINDALRSPSLDPSLRSTLALAQRNGQRLRKLVNSLLDISRIEAGRADTNFQATDLSAFTIDLTSLFRSAVESTGLKFDVIVDPTLPPIYVDRDMWEKVVLNLLSNALKFTFEGGITVRLSRQGEVARLSVTDTGIGIQKSNLSRVFERFQRVAGTRSRVAEGTGIGLALVRELVKLHGGTVSVESEWGNGTAFTVDIPLGQAHVPESQPRTEASPMRLALPQSVDELLDINGVSTWTPTSSIVVPPPEGAGESLPDGAPKRESILIVDDNADMRAYLQRILSARWSIVMACDGQEALAAIDASRPDLVITDVMMPNIDGFEFLKRLREQLTFEYLPVMVLSARAGDEARVAGLHQGADDYLVKPFSTPELLARVEVQLMRSRVRRAEEAINKRLADVFRAAPVGVALLRGPDHVFEFANPVYSKIVSDRQLSGKPIRDALPEIVEQGFVKLLDEVYATGQPFKGQSVPVDLFNAETGLTERRHFEFVYQPLPETFTAARGIAIVVVDVSELVSARLAAEAASRTKDEFMAVLGHELRNPLAPIYAAVQLMKRRHPDVATRERDIIDRQARHMARLVDDLMDVARITRGNLTLRRQVVELFVVVRKAIETTTPLFQDKQQVVGFDVPETGLLVFGDETRLCQVVSNLLVNASKFTPTGGAIQVMATASEGDAVLTVADNGIGMDAEELTKVFDLFTQGTQEMHRPRGGLGLGLAIARNLVRMHEGSVTATSAGHGKGSVFTLTLPLTTDVARGAGVGATNVQASGRAHRILVVDDNVDAGNTVADLLREHGHHVLLAEDAKAALRLIESEEKIDVAILDIGLPGIDGYELAARLREAAAFRGARFVALTGFGQASDVRRSLDRNFHAHLVKPVETADLLTALDWKDEVRER